MPPDLLPSLHAHIQQTKAWLRQNAPTAEVTRIILRQIAIIEYLKKELERQPCH